jgi:hypothetical protein
MDGDKLFVLAIPGFAIRSVTYLHDDGTEDVSNYRVSISLAWLFIPWFILLVRANNQRNRRLDREERLANNQCLSCGYSMVGNTSGTCPECGTPHLT